MTGRGGQVGGDPLEGAGFAANQMPVPGESGVSIRRHGTARQEDGNDR